MDTAIAAPGEALVGLERVTDWLDHIMSISAESPVQEYVRSRLIELGLIREAFEEGRL